MENYIIRFNYEGVNYYANVFETHHSPSQYNIAIINAKHYGHIPAKILLQEEGNTIVSKTANAPAALVNAIINAISNRERR